MSHIFYPRGGSAQVARYLSRALIDLGHEVRLITGTLHDGDPQHDANVFFEDIPLTVVDYTDAWRGFEQGEDPLSDKGSTSTPTFSTSTISLTRMSPRRNSSPRCPS